MGFSPITPFSFVLGNGGVESRHATKFSHGKALIQVSNLNPSAGGTVSVAHAETWLKPFPGMEKLPALWE